MPFVKYEVETASASEVRVGKLGISISRAGLDRSGIGDADYVNLYWNADAQEIGIAPATAQDKSAFKINPRGKQGDKFVAAGKFYEKFGIAITGRNATDGKLADRDGIAAFKVNQPRVETIRPPYTGKPRGRRKKVVEVPAE